MERWRPGDTVVLREMWGGRVWCAYPAIVVEDRPDRRMFHIPNGVWFMQPVASDGRRQRIPAVDWRLEETRWEDARVLSFAFPDSPYAVILRFDDPSGSFGGYYLNLESPLVPSPVGFDYVEHLLDVIVPSDRSSWRWKDEDELRQAVALGLFTEQEAAAFYAAGERAVEHVLLREPPFDESWEDWRPDPSWPVPELPEGWDVL